MLRKIFDFKILLVLLAILFVGIGLLVFALNQDNYSSNLSLAQKYAPNFWFDSEEEYYPCDYSDFYYDKNGNEIPGEEAVANYNKLTKEEKLNHFKVFYKIKKEPEETVVEYWLFYVYDKFWVNRHHGDAESVYVFLNKDTGRIDKIVTSEHWGDKTKAFLANAELDNPKVNHINILVEKGSHANCPDGNNDGLFNAREDITNWYNAYGISGRGEEDVKHGVKIDYNDPNYRLVPLSELQEKLKGKEKLEKSPRLGALPVKVLGKQHYLIPLGGGPADLAAIGDKPDNPEKVEPVTGEWVMNKMSDFSARVKKNVASFAESVGSAFHSVISSFRFQTNQANISQGIQLIKPPERDSQIKKGPKPASNPESNPEPKPKPKPPAEEITTKSKSKSTAPKMTKEEIAEQLSLISQQVNSIQAQVDMLVAQRQSQEASNPPPVVSNPPPVVAVAPSSPGDGGTAVYNGAPTNPSPPPEEASPPPEAILNISSSSFNFETIEGEDPTPEVLTINNDGEADMDWHMEISYGNNTPDSIKWLEVNPNTGTTPASGSSQVTLSPHASRVDTSGTSKYQLEPGNYQAIIDVEAAVAQGDQAQSGQAQSNQSQSNPAQNSPQQVSVSLSISPKPVQKPAPEVVISEIFFDAEGSDEGKEFVELYNQTNSEIDISSWSLQYLSPSADSVSKIKKKNFEKNNKIDAKSYFLVGLNGREGDMSWKSGSLGNKGGTVFLVENQENISGPDDEDIVDRVGYGTGEGLILAEKSPVDLTNFDSGESIGRKWNSENQQYQDTDDNSVDFELQTPTPGSENQAIEPPASPPGKSTIIIEGADSVWTADLYVSSKHKADIRNSSDTLPSNLIKYAFVSHADSKWKMGLDTSPKGNLVNSTDALPENWIVWAFVSHADSKWKSILENNLGENE